MNVLRRQVLLAEWNGNNEPGPAIELAFHAHVATMQIDQLPHKRQPDPAAFIRTPSRTLDAVETLKQAWNFIRRNACAGVAHGQLRRRIRSAEGNFDLSFKGKLERVREQV